MAIISVVQSSPALPPAFAMALERVFDNAGDARRMGEAAQETVRDRYLETRSLLDHLELLLTHA